MTTNFNELQAAWIACDQQLASQKALSEKLIVSMIRDRSHSTLAAMGRKNVATAALFLLYTVFFAACITGNAFDYTHPFYYIPLVVQTIACLVSFILLLNVYNNISKVQLAREDLKAGLQKVIRVNEQHVTMSKKIWWCYFIAAVLFPFTFLQRSIEHRGLTAALGFTLIFMVIIGLLVLLAKKLHLFRDRQGESLKENLHELEGYLAELEKV